MKRICFLLLIACLLFASCNKKHTPPVPPTPVNAFTVKAQTVLYYDRYPANIVALSQVDLRGLVQGYITGIFFTEGSHIHKGQKLYEIDQQLYEASYNQAKANVQVAEGNLKQAQQDADRYVYLNSQDAIAKQTLDHAVITLQNAKNTVTGAQQALKAAATNLNYAVIAAPFDGTIGFSQVKLGNMITVGQTILNTISTDDPMGVDFLISEKQLSFFENLKNNTQQTIDSLFTIVLPNDSIYPYTGKISVIDRAVDPQTGTIKVRIVFPNPNYALRPGTSCVVRVHNQEKGQKLVVPNRALVELMGEYFVYLVKDSTVRNPNDTTKTMRTTVAVQKKVQTGQTIAPNIIIKSGINAGDKIVVDGLQTLHSGSIIILSKKPNEISSTKK
jgi:RND family efflux transporter MFP subunit